MGVETYKEIRGELGVILNNYFKNDFRFGYIRAEGVVLPKSFTKCGNKIRNLEVYNEDVWVVSFPKTGTTWTQEMVWCIANNLDFEKAKQVLPERFPFLEHTPLFDYTEIVRNIPELVSPPHVDNSVQFVTDMTSPRFIKTHLPWSLLPQQIQDGAKKPKLIYVCRNAKDTCLSYYNHCVLLEGYVGSFDDFCKLFLGDAVCFAPFWSHVLEFWERRHQPNVLFLQYEELKKDLPAVIQKTSQFLGKTLTEEQVAVLADHLSFESMKNNKAVNYEEVININRRFGLIKAEGQFMRSGAVGEGKQKMSRDTLQEFDSWTKENLKGTGLEL